MTTGPLPDWTTVKVLPAIVRVPSRPETPFELTLKFTAPLPLPLLPDVMPMYPLWLVAVHGQPDAAVMLTEPLPPATPIVVLAALRV